MIRLMLHGAIGTLGESESVERFEFDHMEVKPTLAQSRRELKVAYLPYLVALHGLAQSIWVVQAGTGCHDVRVFRISTHGSAAFSSDSSNPHSTVFKLLRGPTMKVLFLRKDFGVVRWQQRGVERLRQALQSLQRLLPVDRQTEALALIPIRAVQSNSMRQRQRRTWRD